MSPTTPSIILRRDPDHLQTYRVSKTRRRNPRAWTRPPTENAAGFTHHFKTRRTSKTSNRPRRNLMINYHAKPLKRSRFNLNLILPSSIYIPLGTPRERPAYVKKTGKVHCAPRSGKERQAKRVSSQGQDDEEEKPPGEEGSSNPGGDGGGGGGGGGRGGGGDLPIHNASISNSAVLDSGHRDEQLFKDIWYGNPVQDQRLKVDGLDLQAGYDHNWTLLMAASDGEEYQLARKLVKKVGAKVDWLEKIGQFPTLPRFSRRMKEIILPAFGRPAGEWPPQPQVNRTSDDYLETIRVILEARRVDVDQKASDSSLWTALFYAVFDGDLALVNLLLSHYANYNHHDSHGRSPLHIAARLGHLDIVKRLYYLGANVKSIDKAGHTPITIAAEHGHIDIVELLLAGSTADEAERDLRLPNLPDRDPGPQLYQIIRLLRSSPDHIAATIDAPLNSGTRCTPLMTAAMYCHYNLVYRLLRLGVKINIGPNATLLQSVAQRDQADILDLLLSNGANPNLVNGNDFSPLITTVLYRNFTMAEKLLVHGADVNIRNSKRQTILHLAAQEGHIEIVDFLLRHCPELNPIDINGYSPFMTAVYNGRFSVMEKLLAGGADINLPDIRQRTPLHIASIEGHLQIFDLLLQRGADLYTVNNLGETPLVVAVSRGHFEIVKRLLTFITDINHKYYLLSDALRAAIAHDRIEIINLLFQHGANPNTLDKIDRMALFDAVEQGTFSVVKRLLELGAKVDGVAAGRTPLIEAVRGGRMDIIELLVEHGANLQYRWERQWPHGIETPLAIAVEMENSHKQNPNPRIIVRLIELGAEVGRVSEDIFSNAHPIIREILLKANWRERFAMFKDEGRHIQEIGSVDEEAVVAGGDDSTHPEAADSTENDGDEMDVEVPELQVEHHPDSTPIESAAMDDGHSMDVNECEVDAAMDTTETDTQASAGTSGVSLFGSGGFFGTVLNFAAAVVEEQVDFEMGFEDDLEL